MVAVAHLALARSQNTGAGILGKQMTKSSLSGLLFRRICFKNLHGGARGIRGNRNVSVLLKKFIMVLLWIVLAVGIYWCNRTTKERGEPEAVKEDNEVKEEAQTRERVNDDVPKEAEISREEALSDVIRVLIKTDGFAGIYHDTLTFVCDNGLVVTHGDAVWEYGAGEAYVIDKSCFASASEPVVVAGKNQSAVQIAGLKRSVPVSYRGRLECFCAQEGLVLVNELKVEEYLYGVVPSEMPSSYPPEALKAQAVSARTYTYFHKKSYAYPAWRANVDDSTAFQVYKNIDETAEAVLAVDETKHQVLTYEDEVIESFYYSTSSGYNGGARVWNTQESEADLYLPETGDTVFAKNNAEGEAAYQAFIDNGNPSDVEFNEAWYRWVYEKGLEGEACRAFLQKLYHLSKEQPQKVRIRSQYLPKEKILEEKAVKDIWVLEREKSGLVTGIMIKTQNFMVSVKTQHTIRQVLGMAGDTLVKKDGEQYIMGDLLSSAYFYMEKKYDNNMESGDNLKGIVIHGAGLGHGCGMSQNGAKQLAQRGFTADEILAYYYNGAIKSAQALQ